MAPRGSVYFTGFIFPVATSVGTGQVLEFYMNFGTIGVIGGSGNDLLDVDDVASSGFYNGWSITSTCAELPNASVQGRRLPGPVSFHDNTR